jgi:hypothetical protein
MRVGNEIMMDASDDANFQELKKCYSGLRDFYYEILDSHSHLYAADMVECRVCKIFDKYQSYLCTSMKLNRDLNE